MDQIELLIIKEGDDYFRFRDSSFERCVMSKASVFPLDQEQQVDELLKLLAEQGLSGTVMKLIIREELYSR